MEAEKLKKWRFGGLTNSWSNTVFQVLTQHLPQCTILITSSVPCPQPCVRGWNQLFVPCPGSSGHNSQAKIIGPWSKKFFFSAQDYVPPLMDRNFAPSNLSLVSPRDPPGRSVANFWGRTTARGHCLQDSGATQTRMLSQAIHSIESCPEPKYPTRTCHVLEHI